MSLMLDSIDAYYGPVQALRGLSLRIEDGEMVALLGANGAGKTTTLRTISGMLSPTAGDILLDGRPIAGLGAEQIVRLRVAHMPEGRELFPELTVTENLQLGHWTARKDRNGEHQRIEEMFDLFPKLQERAGQAAGTMSGGEQQMLTFARAMMSDPKLLLVDELSLGLAPIVVQQLFEALDKVNKAGCAVLLVEQFVHLALKHTSRAYVLAKGEIAVEGASADLLASPDVMAAYLGEAAPAAEPAAPGGGSGSDDPGPRKPRSRGQGSSHRRRDQP